MLLSGIIGRKEWFGGGGGSGSTTGLTCEGPFPSYGNVMYNNSEHLASAPAGVLASLLAMLCCLYGHIYREGEIMV